MQPLNFNRNRYQAMFSAYNNSNDLSFAGGETTGTPGRNSIETVPTTTPLANATNSESPSPQTINAVIVLLSLVATAGWAFFAYLDRRKQTGLSLLPIRARTTPCKSCRFFHSSDLLKCAVHPTRALTPEAEDCQDFEPNNKQKEA